MNRNKVLCVVAGKSGGHIIPGIIYVRNWTQLNPEYSVLFFSSDTELDRSIIALYPYVFSYIPLHLMPLPGKRIWQYPRFIAQFIQAFFISLKNLRFKRPDRVVSMGGLIGLPVCLAAWCLSIPIELFELNAVPGKAIRWLAPLARKIYVCFDEVKPYFKHHHVEVAPYPLRFEVQDEVPSAHGRMQLGLDQAKKTLLILGGSQGSKSINELMVSFFEEHPEIASSIQVIHQAGGSNVPDLEAFYKKEGIQALVFDYMHDLQYCYAAADLVVARAGAGTLFELLFFEKKSILIPLEISTTDHQVDNAQAMVKKRPDLFVMIRQADIVAQPNSFGELILKNLEAMAPKL